MSSLERTWSSASSRSGVTPLSGDTWPAEGLGGCRGTGQALPFFVGGYASSGCAGALPLGRHELKTNTSMKSSQFFQNLSTSLLLAMETKEPAQELSPTSVVNFTFEEEIEIEEEIARGELACATD
ncbi:hypothetical protein COHA_001345 [Chlorella ohadii]|uniref:Uncharacterized protein n=1 Tax=Chlorella ohadii TaxID=2649997 RepID=A0AAD5E208_9CHLO|nr:hypothetical protein COHA_001345 [Chlorella ohadii]